MTTLADRPSAMTLNRLWPMESDFEPTGDEAEPSALRAARRVREITEERLAEVETIRGDKYLSDAGKLERIKATHEAAQKRLEPFVRHLEGLEDEIKAQSARVAPKGLDPGDAVGAAAGTEYRAYLRGLDHEKRVDQVNRAVIDGDVETLGKIAGGPPELSGLTPQMWTQARTTLIEKQNPEGLERLRKQAGNVQGLRRSLDHSRSIMSEVAGLGFDRSTVGV